uniref:ATP dependent DNA ligase n=1 Tax=Sinorhizobium psoraleae TaxID=520838 RepID=UPI001569A570
MFEKATSRAARSDASARRPLRKNAVFTEPLLIADVEYRAWTDDWKLRHASFKRGREDDAAVFELLLSGRR